MKFLSSGRDNNVIIIDNSYVGYNMCPILSKDSKMESKLDQKKMSSIAEFYAKVYGMGIALQ